MEGLIPTRERRLCRLADLADGAARGFAAAPGGFTGLFGVRQGDTLRVYVNSCPHIGIALDWSPDRFLSQDLSHILCSTHGAEFRIEDGYCVRGPCEGDRLQAVPIRIIDGCVLVAEDAGL
jgi:nitrite reductase/ring-hydroxylating ferredoxin subunit